MKKGITISTLTISVAIMTILISVSTVAGIGSIRTAAYEEFLSKLTRVSNDVNFYIKKTGELPITNEIVAKEGLSETLTELISNNGDSNNELFVVDMDKLNTETVNIGYGTVNNMDVFLVAKDTNNIYYLKGYKYKNEMYHGIRGEKSIQTLGKFIKSAADYGKTVDYTVTVDGTTYSDWQIYYHNSDYVYLISTNSIGNTTLNKETTVASLTKEELELYEKFRVGTSDKYPLVDTLMDNTEYNCQAVAYLIKGYANFANTTHYGSNVVGAIGGPTIELLVAGWNAKEYTPTIALTTGDFGYQINGVYYIEITSDGLYVPSDFYWLASPASRGRTSVMIAGDGRLNAYNYSSSLGIRPVVCIKSNIPATAGTTTDYTLVVEQEY